MSGEAVETYILQGGEGGQVPTSLSHQLGENDANKVAAAARWAECAVDQVGPGFRIIKVKIADAISDASLTSRTSRD